LRGFQWDGGELLNYGDPDAADFGVGPFLAITGTIQRVAGEYCYALTYSDAYGAYTVYLPFDAITYAEGGHDLPNVIAEPVAVDYIKIYSSTMLMFGYQGVYYTADYSSSCPYTPPVMTVAGSYSPYRVWNDNIKVYDWYWNLHYDATWDASHLPPGVVLQRIDWFIDGSLGTWGTYRAKHMYQVRFPGWPDLGLPPQELPVVSGNSMNDGYSWLGCYAPDLDMCPADEWVQNPPFTAGITLTTIDGNTYTTTAAMNPA